MIVYRDMFPSSRPNKVIHDKTGKYFVTGSSGCKEFCPHSQKVSDIGDYVECLFHEHEIVELKNQKKPEKINIVRLI